MTKLYSMVPLVRIADYCAELGNRAPAAIGAFNVNFYAQAAGILEGLRRADAPGIIQASKGANKFQGDPDKIQQIVLDAMRDLNVNMPICLHLDHGDYEEAAGCIAKGFSSVMIDYSTKKVKKGDKTVEEKRSVEENVFLTRPIVLAAHEKGLSVEGEMGVLAGMEDNVSAEKSIYPSAEEVLDYVKMSGVDAVAVACGTSHGPIKNYKGIEFQLLKESYQKLKDNNLEAVLVLHGSSTVPKYLVEEIEKYGGLIKKASGVPIEDIKNAISCGVRKVNIDTDLRMEITAAFRKYFAENKGVEEKSEYMRMVKDVFDGKIVGKDKDGKPVDPAGIIDPRSYLQTIIDVNPRMLREDYRDSGDYVFAEIMDIIKERVARHVEHLVNEFGSAGLADAVRAEAFASEL